LADLPASKLLAWQQFHDEQSNLAISERCSSLEMPVSLSLRLEWSLYIWLSERTPSNPTRILKKKIRPEIW
jgi:hypothetical protein